MLSRDNRNYAGVLMSDESASLLILTEALFVQLRLLFNVQKRHLVLYSLCIVLVGTNAIFIFFASIHCPSVIEVQGQVLNTCRFALNNLSDSTRRFKKWIARDGILGHLLRLDLLWHASRSP